MHKLECGSVEDFDSALGIRDDQHHLGLRTRELAQCEACLPMPFQTPPIINLTQPQTNSHHTTNLSYNCDMCFINKISSLYSVIQIFAEISKPALCHFKEERGFIHVLKFTIVRQRDVFLNFHRLGVISFLRMSSIMNLNKIFNIIKRFYICQQINEEQVSSGVTILIPLQQITRRKRLIKISIEPKNIEINYSIL